MKVAMRTHSVARPAIGTLAVAWRNALDEDVKYVQTRFPEGGNRLSTENG